MVYADIEHTSIIFRNLLSNALKFSYTETQIDILAEERAPYMHISITDHGIGMSTQKINELFNVIQTPTYGTSGERGTGLGLVLVRNLLQINGGTIEVKSTERKGTTFYLKLPLFASAELQQQQ